MGGGEGRKGSGWSGLAGWGIGRGDDGHTSGQPPPSFVIPGEPVFGVMGLQ